MFFYKAYGLSISSEMHLPELSSNDLGKDVFITFGNVEPPEINIEERYFGGNSTVRFTSKGAYLFLDQIYICRISLGKEIVINPNTKLDESFLRVIILGPALSILLHQRGNLILHASAININGRAVAFLGNNGCGKSTSLIALHKNGYPIVTDDILPVKFNNEGLPIVTPSYSRMKLRSDVMNYMQGDIDFIPKTHVYSDKYYYFTENNFSHKQLPLKKIYIIQKGEEWSLNSLNPNESLMKLVKSSYCYGISSKEEIVKNLNECSKLVNNLPIKLLKIPQSLEQLPELIKIIENDNSN